MHRFHPQTHHDPSQPTNSKQHRVLILGNITDQILFFKKWDEFKKKHDKSIISEIIAVDSDPVYINAEKLAEKLGVLFILFKKQDGILNLVNYADSIFICVDETYPIKDEIEAMRTKGHKAIVFSQVLPI